MGCACSTAKERNIFRKCCGDAGGQADPDSGGRNLDDDIAALEQHDRTEKVTRSVKTAQLGISDTQFVHRDTNTDSAGSANEYLDDEVHRGAPFPANEEDRCNFLCSLNMLDTESERRFDDITRLCCMIFKVPISFVSLVDRARHWNKSMQGADARQLSRNESFCAWTLLPKYPEVLVVEDALKDARFKNHILVKGEPFIRFYAGAPLVSSTGLRLGSLCIIDTEPRSFDVESCNVLANMAEMVMREMERDHIRAKSHRVTAEQQLLRALSCFSEGIMLCNLSLLSWPILFVNDSWEEMTGIPCDHACGSSFWSLFHMYSGSSSSSHHMALQEEYTRVVQQQDNFIMQGCFLAEDGSSRWLTIEFRCASNTTLSEYMPSIGVPNFLESNAEGPIYYFGILKDEAPVDEESQPFAVMPRDEPFEDIKLGPLLGKGAYGRVYRASWNGAEVAVKVVEYPYQGKDAGPTLEALLHEEVSHPNIVQTYRYLTRAVMDKEGQGLTMMETWLVLEFCNRANVQDAIVRGWFRGPRSPNLWSILVTAKEIASALALLHSRNILHGDLSSNNILLTSSDKDDRNFVAKVSDFGLSRVLAPGLEAIQTTSYGTVTHMPPELLVNGIMSRAADVYAFGVVLWEMYMGHRAFQGMWHGQVIHYITTGRGLELSTSAPEGFRTLVHACLARTPSDRPSFPQILEAISILYQDLYGTID